MRKHWLDNIRWVTVVLVLIYHVFYIFNSVGFFGGLPPFAENQPQDIILYILFPWFMVLLFVVSGISSRLSLKTHSPRDFFKSRTLKLLVPSTIGVFVIHWITGYYNTITVVESGILPLAQMPFIAKWVILSVSGTGPLWFIQDLWLYSVILLLLRKIDRKDAIYKACGKVPSWIFVIASFFVIWGASFILHPANKDGNLLSLYRPVFYLVAYLMGYYFFSHEKHQEFISRNWLPVLFIAIVNGAYYIPRGFGEPCAPTHLRMFFYNAFLWAMVLTIIGLFRRYANKTSAFSSYMSRSSFGFYILHYIVLAAVAWNLRNHTELGAIPTYIIVTLAVAALTPALYEIIRRIPVLKWCILGIGGKRKIMVTGPNGFLGRHLVKALKAKGFKVVPVGHKQMDLTDEKAIMRTVRKIKPDYVIHCAALSQTGYCAEHPDESFAVNAQGPATLAKACRKWGAGLIFMSSDQVYGGCKFWGPLSEDLELEPNNIYGRDKLKGEGMVLAELPSAIGLRLTWMFQQIDEQNPHADMMSRLAAMAQNEDTMKASTKELRGISDVDEVCDNIIRLIGRVPGGIYNFGSGNVHTTYETMCNIVPQYGIAAERVLADDSWGRNLSMDGDKLAAFGITFRTTEEALEKKN